MKTSERGRELIKSFEGIRDGDPTTVNLDPYICPAGLVTIGWGHVVTDDAGRALRGRDGLAIARTYYPDGITWREADNLLTVDLERTEQGVETLLRDAPVNQNQFDALVSFAFNVGLDIDDDQIPEGLGDSTLLKLVRSGDLDAAAEQFTLWDKARDPESGKLVALAGLTRRRQAERILFKTV